MNKLIKYRTPRPLVVIKDLNYKLTIISFCDLYSDRTKNEISDFFSKIEKKIPMKNYQV